MLDKGSGKIILYIYVTKTRLATKPYMARVEGLRHICLGPEMPCLGTMRASFETLRSRMQDYDLACETVEMQYSLAMCPPNF